MFQKLGEIKKQLLYYVEHIQSRIIESNTFNALKEKYQSYSLFHQKIIKYGIVSVIVFLISFIPFYNFYLSSKYWSEFKEKRKLSLDLLRVRNYKSNFLDLSEYKLRQDVVRIIKKYKEKDYSIKDNPVPSKEKNLKKVIYEVKVNHLNIRQAVQMGVELHNILSAHLSSLQMQESDLYPKHYDVSFELSVYFSKAKKMRESSRVRPKMEGRKKPSNLKRNRRFKEDRNSRKKRKSKSYKDDLDKKPSKFLDKKPLDLKDLKDVKSKTIKLKNTKEMDVK